jgi:hypothetical protein
MRRSRRGYNPQFSTAHLLHAALNALLTLTDTTKPWRPLVETACSKLSKRGKRKARSMMLCF